MTQLLAHITQNEFPTVWVAMAIGFVAGVAVTYFFAARKAK